MSVVYPAGSKDWLIWTVFDDGIYYELTGSSGYNQLKIAISPTNINYNFNLSYINLTKDGFEGKIGKYFYNSGVSFSGMNAVDAKLSSGNDKILINILDAQSIKNRYLKIDAGLGQDRLDLRIGFNNFSFDSRGPNGPVTSLGSNWQFRNFEDYTITTAGGSNRIFTGAGSDIIVLGGGAKTSNIVSTGAGNDQIYSAGGTDIIDGGSGYDTWYLSTGDSSTVALILSYDATAQSGLFTTKGKISGKNYETRATAKNIEFINGIFSTGNDSVTLKGDIKGRYWRRD